MSEEQKKPIKSVNQSIIDELAIATLESRVELSPVGVLDVMLENPHHLDPQVEGNCSVDNTCGSKDNCVGQGNCGVQGKCGSKGGYSDDDES